MKNTTTMILMGVSLFLFTACAKTSPKTPDSSSFKQGNHDGCATAKGTYTKSSEMFRKNADYQEGWFYGRKHCNPIGI